MISEIFSEELSQTLKRAQVSNHKKDKPCCELRVPRELSFMDPSNEYNAEGGAMAQTTFCAVAGSVDPRVVSAQERAMPQEQKQIVGGNPCAPCAEDTPRPVPYTPIPTKKEPLSATKFDALCSNDYEKNLAAVMYRTMHMAEGIKKEVDEVKRVLTDFVNVYQEVTPGTLPVVNSIPTAIGKVPKPKDFNTWIIEKAISGDVSCQEMLNSAMTTKEDKNALLMVLAGSTGKPAVKSAFSKYKAAPGVADSPELTNIKAQYEQYKSNEANSVTVARLSALRMNSPATQAGSGPTQGCVVPSVTMPEVNPVYSSIQQPSIQKTMQSFAYQQQQGFRAITPAQPQQSRTVQIQQPQPIQQQPQPMQVQQTQPIPIPGAYAPSTTSEDLSRWPYVMTKPPAGEPQQMVQQNTLMQVPLSSNGLPPSRPA